MHRGVGYGCVAAWIEAIEAGKKRHTKQKRQAPGWSSSGSGARLVLLS
ncbi:hypothetical protein J2Y41_001886 [Arthrobacter sp. 1088]|nr:hypothetical protein [Arthrobacter sp. 1088]